MTLLEECHSRHRPRKKMAQHYIWILLLCLQTCLEAAGSNTNILTVNGILGDPVSFPLNIQESQKIANIAWVNSKTSVALVVPRDAGTAPQVTVTHQNYQKRINVSHQNYDLEISNLRMEDAGIYKADINIRTPETKEFTTITRSYNLQVYRKLGKPKITQSLMTSVNSTCNVTLTCSVEKEEKNVIYSWSPLGEEGSVLQIFQTPENQQLTYTCTAQNPVSNNSDSISGQQLCSGIAMGLHTRHVGLLSGLAVLSLFILILPSVLLFLLCKREQGRGSLSMKHFQQRTNLTALKSSASVSSANNMIWLFQFLTLVFCLGPGNTISQTPLIGVLEESVTLPLKFPAEEETQSITWLHNGTSIIFIVFIQSKEALIRVTDPKFKDRLKVTQSYSLQIKNLTMADTGLYRAQITTVTSSVISDYSLRIFRRLRNLQVANYMQLYENGTCEIHLTCSVENPNDHVSFRWHVSGNILLEEANFTIFWDPKTSSEQTYYCIAENPVSNLSFSFSVQSPCKGSSSFSIQQTQSPADTLRNSQYDPFSPGNTVYAQVTHPNMRMESPTPTKNNDSSTIYSTIYQSKQSNCP
ncbi:SLAM family member 5 isoform X7 [Rhinolophus sinicus]|uniref:SLAM family member 5 isoform X7 n=1 Tax=Rhinolophus sinicus TaxID=89399 RepID=UPI003D7B9D78